MQGSSTEQLCGHKYDQQRSVDSYAAYLMYDTLSSRVDMASDLPLRDPVVGITEMGLCTVQ